MKRTVGCYTNCFGAGGVRVAAEWLPETGLKYLELALRGHNFGGLVIPESAVITVDTPEGQVREFRDLLTAHNVKVSGCNVGGADILTPAGLDLTLRRIAFARGWFHVPVVVCNAGQPADDDQHRVMIDHLRQVGNLAGDLDVTVALETHKGPTQNADAMRALIGEVGHARIRLNFDTGNIGYYNRDADVIAELEKVKDLVRNVHLKDSRGGFEDWYFPAVGDGGFVDFRRVREVLDTVGFAGPYTVEIEGIKGEDEPGLEGRVGRHRQLRGSLLPRRGPVS